MSPLFCLRYPLPKPLSSGEGLATEVACSLRSVILSFVGDNQTVVSWLDMGGKLLAKLFVPGEGVA